MTTLLDRIVAVRSDIEWSSRIVGRRRRWIVYDPIASAFFYFSELEYSIVKLFDGRKSLRQIMASASGLSSGEAGSSVWSLQTWGHFLNRLDQASLLVDHRSGNSQPRWRTIERNQQQAARRRWLGWLAVRWRWGDPSRWVEMLDPLGRLLFRRDVFFCFAMVSVVIWLIVGMQLLRGPDSLLRFDELLQGTRWLGLLVAYLFAKLFHELGHLLAARRFGAGCREIGVMWLCFVPCFYCDTTDSWRIEDPKKRAVVAGAGIYFEWMIASLAGVVWLATTPGGLHAGAANLMVVCSIGTILINANPLVRYDGYYMLSDLADVPNLSEQGCEALFEAITAWFSGRPMPKDRWDASPATLILYGVAGFIYRSLLLVAIVWSLWWFLMPRGLGLIASLLNASLLVGIWIQFTAGLRAFRTRIQSAFEAELRKQPGDTLNHSAAAPLRPDSPRRSVPGFVFRRWLITFGTVSALIGFIGFYPLKSYVGGRAVTHFVDSQALYVESDAGYLARATIGESVVEGDTLIELDVPELRLSHIRLKTEVLALQAKLEALLVRAVEEPASSIEVQALTEKLAERREQQSLIEARLDRLNLRAEINGTLVPGSKHAVSMLTRSAKFDRPEPDRDHWLTTRNQGALAPEGTLLGWVADPKQFELRAVISDQDAERVLPEMSVECRWDARPNMTIRGRIVRLSHEPIATTPEALIGDSRLISVGNTHGEPVPERPHYEVVIEPTQQPDFAVAGSVASIRIETTPETFYHRVARWLRNSLKLPK